MTTAEATKEKTPRLRECTKCHSLRPAGKPCPVCEPGASAPAPRPAKQASVTVEAKLVETIEETRRRIRREKAVRAKQARHQARTLLVGVNDPAPNSAVKAHQKKADEARARAQAFRDEANAHEVIKAKDGKKKRRYLLAHGRRRHLWDQAQKADTEARGHERNARDAYETQKAEAARKRAEVEARTLAQARGEEVADVRTAVQTVIRDEDGVTVRNDEGHAIVHTERASTLRRKTGLELLYDRGKLADHELVTGRRFGVICAEAARAEQPARQEGEGSRSSTSLEIGKDRLTAIRAKAEAVSAFRFLGTAAGATVQLLEDVCWKGHSCFELANRDDRRAARIEERLHTGLAALRYHFLIADKAEREKRKGEAAPTGQRSLGEMRGS